MYIEQGRYEKAEPLLVKVLDIQRGVSGEEHWFTLACMLAPARLYTKQERYDEAEPLLVKALEGCPSCRVRSTSSG